MQLELNPAVDLDLARQQFRAHRRVQVPNFLRPESAEALAQAHEQNRRWFLSYNEGANNVESDMADIQRLTPAQQAQFMQAIHHRAAKGFQYCFVQYYISENIKRGEDPGHPLHAVERFLNSAPFLDFMRALTDEPGIHTADALASIYGPGHFLTDHDDSHGSRQRVAAYVLQLTRQWDRNWGGHLAFFDEQGNITDAFLPSFNTLNVFRVPQPHAVQLVAPFAQGYRRSITGWVHR
ncbi:MAG: 2OG-Fe(II) oxygenase family protein [Lysobacterales bacterium]